MSRFISRVFDLCHARNDEPQRACGHGRRGPRRHSIEVTFRKKQANISGGFHEARAGRIVAAVCVTCTGTAGGAQHPLRVRPQPAAAAAQHVFRRGVGRRGQFQGPCFRAVARQHVRSRLCGGCGATAGIRRQRRFRRRDRQEPLCLVVRPHGQGRSPGQYLGDRQGLGHGHQVRSRKAASSWCSAASRRPPTRRPAR